MKKVLILLTAILFAMQMQAQDVTLLNRIREVNGKVKSFESDLANTMVKPKKTTTQNGKLYFVTPYEFSAQFNTGNYMIVNAQRIKMDIGRFHGTFKLKDGGMMQGLSRIFLYGFQGRLQDLANENGYTVSTGVLSREMHSGIVAIPLEVDELMHVGYVMHNQRRPSPLLRRYIEELHGVIAANESVDPL